MRTRTTDRFVGQRFGALVVLEVGTRVERCIAQCDCGNLVRPFLSNILAENTRSCGCLKGEKRPRVSGHRVCRTAAYHQYRGIITRCTCPSSRNWKNYGGRGITICAGWRNSFESFQADMGKRPTPEHSIDRKDNEGGYWCGHCEECVALSRPANCRWATRREQQSNTRKSVHLTIDGRTMIASEWAREAGISRQLLETRLRRGYTGAELIAAPGTLEPRERRSRHCGCCGEAGHNSRNCQRRAA